MWKKVETKDEGLDGFCELEEYVVGGNKDILLTHKKSSASGKRNKVGKKTSNKSKKSVERSQIKSDLETDETVDETDLSGWLQLKLNKSIAEHLVRNNLHFPKQVQMQAIPVSISHKKDVFVASETGSGKTLCYLLPILQLLLHIKPFEERKTDFEARFFATNKVRAIIVTPTRELAMQVVNEFDKLLKPFYVTCAAVVGGISENKQMRIINKFRPEVIVATPGRLWDFISSMDETNLEQFNKHRGNVDFENSMRYLTDVKGLRLFVIDEIDRLLEVGHFKEFNKIAAFISLNSGDHRRYKIFSYSATLTSFLSNFSKVVIKNNQNPNHLIDLLKSIKKGGNNNFELVDLSNEKLTNTNLAEYKCFCDTTAEKVFNILMFINFLESADKKNLKLIIFVNSIKILKILCNCLKLFKLNVVSLHGKKLQKVRLKAVESFKDEFSENLVDILICTDLAARGLDFDSVDGVVQFEVPKNVNTYVHRSGRTARNGRSGSNLLLVGVNEMEVYKKILSRLNRVESMPSFDVCLIRQVKMKSYFDKKKRLMQKAKIGWKIAEIEDELDLTNKNESWLKRGAESLQLVFEADHKSGGDKEKLLEKRRGELGVLRAEFNHF